MNEPLLSIIVPSKNRHYFLNHLIDLFLSYDLKRTELVISDNSGENLKYTKDIRIKYVNRNVQLSVDENTDYVFDMASGEYVLFLGDDDGFLPNVEKVCLFMKEAKIENLYSPTPVFFWPGLGLKGDDGDMSGVLRCLPLEETGIVLKSTREALRNTFRAGGTRIDYLPRVYHGITSRKLLDKIKHAHGRYCLGPSPDMALSVAVANHLEHHAVSNEPFVISGKCNVSTGGKGVRGKHAGKLENVSHLNPFFIANWPSNIPNHWTGPTVWAASLLIVSEIVGGSTNEFRLSALRGKLMVYNIKDIYSLFTIRWMNIGTLLSTIWWIHYRVLNAVKNKRKYALKKSNVRSITQASRILQNYWLSEI